MSLFFFIEVYIFLRKKLIQKQCLKSCIEFLTYLLTYVSNYFLILVSSSSFLEVLLAERERERERERGWFL